MSSLNMEGLRLIPRRKTIENPGNIPDEKNLKISGFKGGCLWLTRGFWFDLYLLVSSCLSFFYFLVSP